MKTNRRGFIGALLAAPFMARILPKRFVFQSEPMAVQAFGNFKITEVSTYVSSYKAALYKYDRIYNKWSIGG